MKMDSLDELQMYVNLLQKQYNKVFTNYQELIEKLKYEFNLNVSINEIRELYEPTLEEHIEDLKLIYKNQL